MNLTKESVNELIQSCAKGEQKALELFFENYSQDIYNFPLKVFHLTEDDASDFFIYAFERLKTGKRFQSFQGKSTFRTWFYTVLRNMLIDWKRTQKELKVVNPSRINSNGKEYFSIEDEPDTNRTNKADAKLFADGFHEVLSEIKLEYRVIFKLAYIYYLNLTDDEVLYIQEKTGFNSAKIKQDIQDIRSYLSDKEIESIQHEDKLTSLYLNIMELKENLSKEKVQNFNDNLPSFNKIELSIQKKYEQRRKLLDKRHKGHFLSRTPYKAVASLLNIPEGSVSIALQRVIKKISQKLEEKQIY
jgi:RNA polymerase sigma factor (sigma-70 family)